MRTFGDLRNDTEMTEGVIRAQAECEAMEIMWECRWDEMVKADPSIDEELKSTGFKDRMKIRDALYGGRVEVFRLHWKAKPGEVGKALDVVSLYPSVMMFGEFPIGHPETICHGFNVDDLSQYYGLIMCKILPSKVFVPVLPTRVGDRTEYTCCRTCSEKRQVLEQCEHTDEERSITGTWASILVNAAVERGYKVLEVYEIHHYPKRSSYNKETGEENVFTPFIRDLARAKVISSGFPKDCDTDEKKQAYCDEFREKAGIVFEPSEVEDNPGKRTCAKTAVNSPWGRWV